MPEVRRPSPVASPPPPVNEDPVRAVARLMQTAAQDMSRLLADARTHAGGEMAARIAAELPYAIDRLLVQRQRRLVVGAVLAAVIACGGAGVAGWWLRGAPPAVTCGEQAGGVACWYWLQAPKR